MPMTYTTILPQVDSFKTPKPNYTIEQRGIFYENRDMNFYARKTIPYDVKFFRRIQKYPRIFEYRWYKNSNSAYQKPYNENYLLL